jgi:GMP synthase-like glutamine amidotransferase
LNVSGRGWKILGAVLLGLVLVGLVLVITKRTRTKTLTGLLIDLELAQPNPDRYQDLRTALTGGLSDVAPELKNSHVRLNYIHYAQSTPEILNSRDVDFIVLSPQGTPWYRYRGDAGYKLDQFKGELRDLILVRHRPVLGVCGGHQFLALAFGGSVDFIDPDYVGTYPERYPLEALSERGAVRLQILADDPIFRGVATFPGTFHVMESHYEEVKSVPEPFVNLAASSMSTAQLMRIPGLIVYGTAFHPERGWNGTPGTDEGVSSGKKILANFLSMVMERKLNRVAR